MKRQVSIVRKVFVFLVLHVETAFTPKNTLMFASVLATPNGQCFFELESITIGVGNTNWGAPDNECVFILKLGKCIKKNESKDSTEFQPKNS